MFASTMNGLSYRKLDETQSREFLALLNSPKIRRHLVAHDLFTIDSVRAWIDHKLKIDATDGCRVRAIYCDNDFAGWCGIQHEAGGYEIALVLDEKFWRWGRVAFSELLGWAQELGHQRVYIHLLHTRREYKFLKRIASAVYKSELLGTKFTSYELTVGRPAVHQEGREL